MLTIALIHLAAAAHEQRRPWRSADLPVKTWTSRGLSAEPLEGEGSWNTIGAERPHQSCNASTERRRGWSELRRWHEYAER